MSWRIPQVEVLDIPHGAKGTATTIRKMHELVESGKRQLPLIRTVNRICHTCPPHDHLCEARTLHEFVRDNIRYIRDPNGVELVRSARRTLDPEAGGFPESLPDLLAQVKKNSPAGDCDDQAVLVCTLAECIGFPTAFKTVAGNPATPDEWTHVYSIIYVPKQGWMSSDTTEADKPFGWECPQGQLPSARVWRNDSMTMMGVGQLPSEVARELTRAEEASHYARIRPAVELRPQLGGEAEDNMITAEALRTAKGMNGKSGLGQLTPSETTQIAKLQERARRLFWIPPIALATSQKIASIRSRAAVRERVAATKLTRQGRAADEPELSIGPVSEKVLPSKALKAIRERVTARIASQNKGRLTAIIRIAKSLKDTQYMLARARAAGPAGRTKARALSAKISGLTKALRNLQDAKVRPEMVVRKEVEKARVMQAARGGAASIAQYGAQRFREGREVGSGVFEGTIRRLSEFAGPQRAF